MKITLKGEPQSTNHIYKSHCRYGFPTIYMTSAGKTLKESYQWQIKSQWKKRLIKESIELGVKLFFGTKRKQDIDNYSKILLDAFTGIVWEDDKQIEKITIEKFYDKKDPRIEVFLSTLS